ncbi:MAG: NifU N-terminal domain-containing protein [Planctomycetota bacterium]|nr:NifU N-terminal domain-containing protein [Planctomycetota bacterium]
MAYRITQYETTPNPNALKCWLDKPISTRPRSFLNAEMASEDAIADALFSKAGATCVLMNVDWITINKSAGVNWKSMKTKVEKILGEVEH